MPVVQINGTGIHYQESGDRDTPTIVFAHPLIWGPGAFTELLTEIGRDARLLTVDLHGHGLSGYREAMTLEEMAGDYYGLLQELGARKVAWFGYGIGGMIGMRLALAHPDVFDSLVLMAASARPDPSTMKASTLHLWKLFRDGHRQDIADPVMKLLFAPGTYQSRPELIAKCRNELVSIPDAHGMFAAALAAFNRSDVSSELHRIRIRTLVLAGREDLVATPAQADFIAAQIPGAEFKIVDEASQLAGIEKPFEVARLVRDFLSPTASTSPLQGR